ncbi:CidA/LrgA family protein [Anaerobacillus sp. CMMVII]|uniref:CidA/LrgA family protein n=1 Tax=Anaerobacillus sp. CMMVII TaxID=2755588 RepID=UPI0021B793A4|nr:CidA/LrgA family protein [Anaerobacillus sp. CMMVII]MCT8137281.1 CidA/LrgA family protein [Anaerobacillus sp. CMMVII]
MKLIQTILQIAVLYGFYLTGEWLQMTFGLMIPGSIIGMGIFFSMLVTGLFPTRWFEEGTQMLLSHMPLMFLPVTVGVLNYYQFFKGKAFY